MPTWLQNQIRKAFQDKNRYQIKLLNQCWFFYQNLQQQKENLNSNA